VEGAARMEISTIKAQLARYEAAKTADMPDVVVFRRNAPSKIEAFI
jgi:hypothetical protein